MRVEIRKARPADVDAVTAIEDAAFASDRISRRSFARLVTRPTASVLVAEHASAVVGAAVILTRAGSSRCRLYSLATSAPGKGIGSALLEAAEREASIRGCRTIRLEVSADNAPAIALYQRRGYRSFARRAVYYADGADAIVMEKGLEPKTPVGPSGTTRP